MEAVARVNDLYAASQAGFRETRLEGEPAFLAKLRRAALERFLRAGLPTTKEEAWRYTNPAPIGKTPFRAGGQGEVRAAGAALPGKGARIVFVNGRHSAELSRGSFGGAAVSTLSEAIRKDAGEIESRLGKLAPIEKSAFTALNAAFLEDGVFLRIPRGAILEEPIHLVFVSAPGEEPAASYPRNIVVAEPETQATVIETYVGNDGGRSLTNSVTEIFCEEDAILRHVVFQRESLSAFHVHRIAAAQERASRFDSHNLCLGSALARTDIDVLFRAEGSECALNGLFVTDGSQHVDNHTLIDHAKPHCTSRELYKGILGGRSRGVFHGKVIVRPDAQKTDAIQTNKNLLLSNEALVNSTPALEILADDVKCKHGSTIGQLDPAALFYLRARGIAEADARAILTYGFATDVSSRLPVPWIREEIEAYLGGRLARPSEAA